MTDSDPYEKLPFPVVVDEHPDLEDSGFYVAEDSEEGFFDVSFYFRGETAFETMEIAQVAAQEYLDDVTRESVREERRANARYLRSLAAEYERSGGEWGGYAAVLKDAASIVGRGEAVKQTEASEQLLTTQEPRASSNEADTDREIPKVGRSVNDEKDDTAEQDGGWTGKASRPGIVGMTINGWEVMSNHKTLWVNDERGMSRARYSTTLKHMDVHCSFDEQVRTGRSCGHCGFGSWDDFVAAVKRILGLEIPATMKPLSYTEGPSPWLDRDAHSELPDRFPPFPTAPTIRQKDRDDDENP